MHSSSRLSAFMLSGAALMVLGGCSTPTQKAPVEERSRAPVAGTQAPPKALPGAENAGKPGYYSVVRGDTLIRIALDNGVSWRDLVTWNNLDNPNLIEVGQVLRVVPPGDAGGRPIGTAKVEARGLEAAKPGKPTVAATGTAAAGGAATPAAVGSGTGAGSTVASAAANASSASSASSAPPSPAAPPAPSAADVDEPVWQWPAQGPVLSGFEEGKRKGLAIGGKAGDPVLAAADGRVVYAGAGLRGYGNLIIVKHNSLYLTAYAHNQTLLVKEDQAVRKGQKIAEMGSTDADRVQLHFEVRKQGKPIDPARSLPSR